MPWLVKKQPGGQYCVFKKNSDGSAGKKVACHDSKSDAEDHMKALYANVNESEETGVTLVELREEIKPNDNPVGRLLESRSGKIRREIKVIAAGWGSSGYYSESMLKEKGPKVFPAGTHMYMDHPTRTEEKERPERSVKDLAAVFERAATWSESEKGLVTVAEIFPTWQDALTHEGFVNAIGTSIVAYGESEIGKAEGREGPIIELSQGLSTDFVTHAGAGGEVGSLIEEARKRAPGWPISIEEARNANDWLAAYLHSKFTSEADYLFGEGYLTRDERRGLSGAIGEALDAFNAFVEENIPQLMTRDPYGDPSSPVSIETTRSESEEEAMDKETEDRLKSLEERVTEAEAARKSAEEERDELRKENEREKDKRLIARAKEVAEAEVKNVKGLPERAVERAVRDSYNPADLPLDNKGELIESAIKENAKKAAEAEKEYLVGASDKGRVRNNGRVAESGDDSSTLDLSLESDEPEDEELTEATGDLAGVFGELGLSEAAAKVAAEGR